MGKRKQRHLAAQRQAQRDAEAFEQQEHAQGTSTCWVDTGPGGLLTTPTLSRSRDRDRDRAPFVRYTGPRDPITGEPLRDGTARLRIRVDDADVPNRGDDGDGTSLNTRADDVPLTIDTARAYPCGSHAGRLGHYLGGLQWSHAFGEYIAPAFPVGATPDWASWRAWWLSPYVVSRLKSAMGAHVVEALIAVHRNGADWHAEAARLSHSMSWLARKSSWAFALAREFYPRNPEVAKVAAAA